MESIFIPALREVALNLTQKSKRPEQTRPKSYLPRIILIGFAIFYGSRDPMQHWVAGYSFVLSLPPLNMRAVNSEVGREGSRQKQGKRYTCKRRRRRRRKTHHFFLTAYWTFTHRWSQPELW